MPGPLIYHNAPNANLPNVSSYFNNAANIINNGIKGFTDALGEIDIARRNNLTNDLYRTIAQSYDPNNVQSINDAIKAAALSDQFRYVNNDVWSKVTDDFRTHQYEQLDKENLALAKRRMDAYQTAANIARANANIAGTRNANTAAQQFMADNSIRSDSFTAQEVNDLMDSAAKRGLLGAQTAATRARAGREQALWDNQIAEAEYRQMYLQNTNANTDDISRANLTQEIMTRAANDSRLNAYGRYALYSWLRNGEDNDAKYNNARGQYTQLISNKEQQEILNDGLANQTSTDLASQGVATSVNTPQRNIRTQEEINLQRQQEEAQAVNEMLNRGAASGLGSQATWNAINAPISSNNTSSGSNAFINIQETRQQRQAQETADAINNSGGFLPSITNVGTATLNNLGWSSPASLVQNQNTTVNTQGTNVRDVTSGSERSIQATQSGTDFANVPSDVNLGNLTPSEQVATKAIADIVALYDNAKKILPMGNQAIYAGQVLNETAKAKNQLNSSINQALSTNGAVDAIEVYNSQNPAYTAAQVRDLLTVTRTDKNNAQVVEERMATRGNLIDGIIRNAALDGSGIFGYADMDTQDDEYKETIADAKRSLARIFNEGQKLGLNDKQIALIASSYTADQGFWFGNDSIQEDNIIRDLHSFSNAFRSGSFQGASIEALAGFSNIYNAMDSNYKNMINYQQMMRGYQDYANNGGILTQDEWNVYKNAKREYEKAEKAFSKAANQSKNTVGKAFGG